MEERNSSVDMSEDEVNMDPLFKSDEESDQPEEVLFKQDDEFGVPPSIIRSNSQESLVEEERKLSKSLLHPASNHRSQFSRKVRLAICCFFVFPKHLLKKKKSCFVLLWPR